MTEDVPPPEETRFPLWVTDPKAVAEEENWADEDALTKQKRTNDLNWLWWYGKVVVALLIFFALLFLGSLTSWAAHYLLLSSYHWLDNDQFSKIQSVLFSGSVGGVVTLVANKHLSK
jgi:hypothetical protein